MMSWKSPSGGVEPCPQPEYLNAQGWSGRKTGLEASGHKKWQWQVIQINSELETSSSDSPLDCSLAVGALGRKVWAAVDSRGRV